MSERVNIIVFIYTLDPAPYFLFVKRTEKRGGFWQPISGGIEENELPIQALYREVYEETGIININSIIDLEHSYTYSTLKNNMSMRMKDVCFGAKLSKIEEVVLSEEHTSYKWCTESEVPNYLNWRHNLESFSKLKKNISTYP